MSEAVAEMVVVPETVAAFAGAVIETDGGVVSTFAIVTDTGADVVRLPAASRAIALSRCGPFNNAVVFHDV